jgi:hypothetical protein
MYSIAASDPSYVVYPAASLYYQTGVSSQFTSALSSNDKSLLTGFAVTDKTENDRLMGKISRFSIDYNKNGSSGKFSASGYKPLDNTLGVASSFYALICPGTADLSQTFVPNPELPVVGPNTGLPTTQVTTNVLGHETVSTNNIENLVNQDSILVDILTWLLQQRN